MSVEQIEAKRLPTLADAGSVLGIATAALFVGSVVYDSGYLAALDLNFRDVPATLADHTSAALLWAPVLALLIFPFVFWELTFGRIRSAPRAVRIRTYTIEIVTSYAAAGFLAWTALHNHLAVYWAAAFTWGWTGTLSIVAFLIRKNSPPFHVWATLVIAPCIIVGIHAWGWSDARDAYERPTQFAQTANLGVRPILRIYERGALLRDTNGTTFVRWENVSRVFSRPQQGAPSIAPPRASNAASQADTTLTVHPR